MNAIAYSLGRVKQSIPRQILEAAFISKQLTTWSLARKLNIDQEIINAVIAPRVLIDCNLVGGSQAMIALSGLGQEIVEGGMTVIHIPKERTQGRSINSALHVAFYSAQSVGSYLSGQGSGYAGYNTYNGQNNNTALMAATQGVMTSFDQMPLISTSKVQLIAENTILIKDNIILSPGCFLRCILDNDENLNNIQMRSYRLIANLVIMAVKAYIYNELVIDLGQGRLQGGAEIGVFKDIISGYSDADQNYMDYLNDVIEALLYMNDSESYMRLIKLNIGSNR